MKTVVTPQNLKPLDVNYLGTTLNVETDLRNIAFKEWDPRPGWMLLPGEKESTDWRIIYCRLGARSSVNNSFSYRFEYALDKVTGKQIGSPTLRLTFELDDSFKPDSELIAEFEGIQAQQLWDIVANKFPAAEIKETDLDQSMFEG